jgi:hypothetical protein
MPNQTIAKTSRKPTTRSQKKIEKSRTSRLPRPPVQSQRGRCVEFACDCGVDGWTSPDRVDTRLMQRAVLSRTSSQIQPG